MNSKLKNRRTYHLKAERYRLSLSVGVKHIDTVWLFSFTNLCMISLQWVV